MKNRLSTAACLLALFAATPAVAMDTLNTRDHSCLALQEKTIENGQLRLKTLFGSLTVYNPLKHCGTKHQVTSPVWKTADVRHCIVGSYCTPVYSSDDL